MKTPIAARLALVWLAVLVIPGLPLAGSAVAAERQTCEIPGYLLFGSNELKRVHAAVVQGGRLTVAVVGTGSSILAGPDGPRSAYPARLEGGLGPQVAH